MGEEPSGPIEQGCNRSSGFIRAGRVHALARASVLDVGCPSKVAMVARAE